MELAIQNKVVSKNLILFDNITDKQLLNLLKARRFLNNCVIWTIIRNRKLLWVELRILVPLGQSNKMTSINIEMVFFLALFAEEEIQNKQTKLKSKLIKHLHPKNLRRQLQIIWHLLKKINLEAKKNFKKIQLKWFN